MRAAVDTYNRYGFLVVLDDVGTGYSNLDRVMLVKPDILKADRALVHDLHRDPYKQGVFKALVYLAERVGGWVITEGVKTRDDVVVALDLGADMLQSFFMGRAGPVFGTAQRTATLQRVVETATSFRRYALEQFALAQQQAQHRRSLVHQIAAQLSYVHADDLEHHLRAAITPHQAVASACVLDAAGKQITDTVLTPQPFDTPKTLIFEPPAKGTDHSLKAYFYLAAQARDGIFETRPSVPLPSQRLCVTVSTIFSDADDRPCVLCVHLDVDQPHHV